MFKLHISPRTFVVVIKFPRATYHTIVPSTEELCCLNSHRSVIVLVRRKKPDGWYPSVRKISELSRVPCSLSFFRSFFFILLFFFSRLEKAVFGAEENLVFNSPKKQMFLSRDASADSCP